MWQTEVASDEYEHRLKRFRKERPREVVSALGNLNSFLLALNAGTLPQNVRKGFVHPEPGGVLAITEKGAGKNAIPIRLYVYPDGGARKLYLITLGDKKSQNVDIGFCKLTLKKIFSEGRNPDVQEEGIR